MYKILFTDLDETLLNPDHHVPQVNIDAINKAKEKGVKVVLATGRSHLMTDVTLKEIGIIPELKSGRYNYLDRGAEGLTREQVEEIYRKCYFADAYLSSSNAVTENGELYNVDGNSNRVSAILYGPKSVIMVCGYNKIVKNLEEAAKRVKEIAAPKNTVRLNLDTYCNKIGHCVSLDNEECPEMCSGCHSEGRICCNFVVTAQQRHKDRIKVIIVGEELGY